MTANYFRAGVGRKGLAGGTPLSSRWTPASDEPVREGAPVPPKLNPLDRMVLAFSSEDEAIMVIGGGNSQYRGLQGAIEAGLVSKTAQPVSNRPGHRIELTGVGAERRRQLIERGAKP